jgi:hypothetical protein
MRIAGTAPALALAALLACPFLAQAAPQFTNMNVALYSLDHGKAADTRAEISIMPEGGGEAVAYLDLQGQEFRPNTTVQLVVPAAGTGFNLDQVKQLQIKVKLTPGNYTSWRLGFDVVLHFDDGSQALMGSGTLTVSSGSPEAAVSLSSATVAHPGLMGGMEKFGFRLLSKNTGSSDSAQRRPAPGSAPIDPKQFTHMDMTLDTGDHGKDTATRVEISIVPNEGGPAVAYLDIQGQGYAPNTKAPEVVPPAGAGFTLSELKHEQILVKVTPSDSGTSWSCKFDAILHFADGTQALLGSGDLYLSAGSTQQWVPLSLASVARPGFFGGVQRLGFKLVSKGNVTQTPVPDASATPAAGTAQSAAAAGSGAPKQTHGPSDFTGMDLRLRSGDRGSAPISDIEISIVPKDGGPALAKLRIAGQDIAAYSTMKEFVPPTAWTSFTAADVKRLQIVVKVTPEAHSTWSHGFDVILNFADHTEALWSTGDMVLPNGSDQESISLSDATIAKRSLLGGFEKFGFGVLNKIGK